MSRVESKCIMPFVVLQNNGVANHKTGLIAV